MHTVNWKQLFNLKKPQGDTNSLDQAPDTILPISLAKKISNKKTPQTSHPCGTRSKTKVNTITLDSSCEDEDGFGIGTLIGSLIGSPRWLCRAR